jgi:hypothetical protein
VPSQERIAARWKEETEPEGRHSVSPEVQTPFPHPQASGSDGPHVWAASQFGGWFFRRRASGTIMTTTLIYEPIAHISDDYFWPPKADGSTSSRDNTDDQGVIGPEPLSGAARSPRHSLANLGVTCSYSWFARKRPLALGKPCPLPTLHFALSPPK